MRTTTLLTILVLAGCGSEPPADTSSDGLTYGGHPIGPGQLFTQRISVSLDPGPTTLHPFSAHFTVTNYQGTASDGRVLASIDGHDFGQGTNAAPILVPANGSASGSFTTYYAPTAGSHSVSLTYQVHNGQLIVPTPAGLQIVQRYDNVDTFTATIQVTAKVAETIAGNGVALLRGGDLGDLSRWCAGDVVLTYSGAASSELDLFGREPEAFAARIAALTDDQILAGAWSSAVAQPDALPRVVAIPSPPSPAVVSLATSDFWGSVPSDGETVCNPAASPSSQINQGAVRAAAVYQHGLCSNSTDLGDDLAQVTSGFWQKFVDSDQTSNEQQKYTKALSTLERTDPSDPHSIAAGFLLAFHYGADIAGSWNEVWGRYRYLFGLTGGLLQIVRTTGIEINSSGPIANFIWGVPYQGLEHDIPDAINDNVRQKQLVEIPLLSHACNVVDDCADSRAALAKLVTPQTVAAAGIPNATATDVQQVRCTLGSDADCAALGRTVDASRWQCATFAGSDGGECRYFVPVQRMNPMPDLLELVLFDSIAPDNPAFALAAAVGRDKVCTFSPTQVATPPGRFYRGFAFAGTASP